jgi:hypothetical protein
MLFSAAYGTMGLPSAATYCGKGMLRLTARSCCTDEPSTAIAALNWSRVTKLLVSNAGSGSSEVAGCEVFDCGWCDVVWINSADLTFSESVVWSYVASGAVCGLGMMSCSPGCKIARSDRSFAARRSLRGMLNDCAIPLSVSPACTV